jgi:hypothetical protein
VVVVEVVGGIEVVEVEVLFPIVGQYQSHSTKPLTLLHIAFGVAQERKPKRLTKTKTENQSR